PFITVNPNIRTQRRYEELLLKGQTTTFEAVKENLLQRDEIDTTREDSPLIKAEDAITIDTSHLTPKKQLEKALEIVREKLSEQR
ncbi:MAG: (d)CMP kinase, partial [Flavobacteriaceae bacterium]|nr:(d)CMP kinase [Flavobacteriaceae bacterium]